MPINVPPPSGKKREEIGIVHSVRRLYKDTYQIGLNLPKKQRFGLWAKIADGIAEYLELAIEAQLLPRRTKLPNLKTMQIRIEIIKQLIRLSEESSIIKDNTYFYLEKQIQDISRMNTNWLNYIEKLKN